MKPIYAFCLICFLLICPFKASGAETEEGGFTKEDRERLLRLETMIEVFMDQTNRRFDELRTDTNKRFEELRNDINKRFEQVDKRFEQVDKRFEQVDKRFEEIDKRFDQVHTSIAMLTNFLWIISGIFTAIMVASIGFGFWDRRTAIRKARDETIQVIEKDGGLSQLIRALREYSREDPKMAKAMRAVGLL